MSSPILIVAYGNPLRCDDGVAWRAAEALEGKFPISQVEIRRLHQLAPEIADALRNRELVLFLDAACVDDADNTRPGEIRVGQVAASEMKQPPSGQFSHVYSPAKVLELAQELYGGIPLATVITVTGQDFGHGDRLSQLVAAAVPALVSKIEGIVRAHLSDS